MEIWINPSCAKCRLATELLDRAGAEYTVRHYLDNLRRWTSFSSKTDTIRSRTAFAFFLSPALGLRLGQGPHRGVERDVVDAAAPADSRALPSSSSMESLGRLALCNVTRLPQVAGLLGLGAHAVGGSSRSAWSDGSRVLFER